MFLFPMLDLNSPPCYFLLFGLTLLKDAHTYVSPSRDEAVSKQPQA